MQVRLEPVVREALEARARTREEMEDVYRCIISAVLLRSGLGAATNIEVVRETTGLFLKIVAFDPSPGALSSANATASSAEKVGITPSLLRSAVVNARQYESFLVTLGARINSNDGKRGTLVQYFHSSSQGSA
ncbi:hypothetical protein AHF37_09085 [Paragonimus kellicotti]|nr:hypothetical protein AHF37_09085 [Paragonimus kellicotti]